MENETLYEITSDLIGNSEPGTLDEIRAIVSAWHYEGWRLEVEEWGSDVRLYAYREDSDEPTPDSHTDWTMVTDDYGYIVIAEEIQ